MKWLANIVVVTVLAVSVEIEYHPPAFVTALTSGVPCSAQERTACGATSRSDQNHKNKKDKCNPMRECSGCVFCATGPANFSFGIFRRVCGETVASVNVNLVEYHASFWHPPQSV
jgi:hypothetical protein